MIDHRAQRHWLCPTARPDTPGVRIFALVDRAGEVPEVRYLTQPLPLGDRELDLLDGAPPEATYRLAAGCAEHLCTHYADRECRLGERLVQLPTRADRDAEPPSCALRPACRWHHDRGPTACHHCRLLLDAPTQLGGSMELRVQLGVPRPAA